MLATLRQGAAGLGLPLSASQLDQFERYQALLLAWNQRMNLISTADPETIQRRHFLDSLSCATATGDLDGRRLVDVGSGAGFPGVPLKIIYPQMRLTLVESVSKKARFLEAVSDALALDGVSVIVVRAEVLGRQPDHRAGYDWALARALAPMTVLAELLLPLCRIGGHILAQKGVNAPAEVEAATQAIQILGGGPARLQPVRLPDQEDEGSILVIVEKIAETPDRYPRRTGVPAKRPLGG